MKTDGNADDLILILRYNIKFKLQNTKWESKDYDYRKNLILKERHEEGSFELAWSSSVWRVVLSSVFSVGYFTVRSLDPHKQSTSKLTQNISVNT